MTNCKICRESNCKKHSFLLSSSKFTNKIIGSSPPEIFIGKWNYPNVYAGILAPQEETNTENYSSPENWHSNKYSIMKILSLRKQLIYGRTKTNIKKLNEKLKIKRVLEEVAMSNKSISTEMHLKKSIIKNDENDKAIPLIRNAVEVNNINLQENTIVHPKVDYLVNDTDAKTIDALKELNNSNISISTSIKLLSAGLLGLKLKRKLVPTRWAITAVDNNLSKLKLEKIKEFKELNQIEVFNAQYVGNHYEFLLLPEKWSFEVVEISLKDLKVWKDYETFFARKNYAKDVTGAYYANRLAITEYLEKIRKQAKVLVFRQISNEYFFPLGVGILRQTSREAFTKIPKKFSSLKDALEDIKLRLKIPVENFTSESFLLKNHGKQKKVTDFF